ncbi:HAMP domain-containing histidine kinase [Solirubrobacter ginsenosidimutans]|uniref:Signal transduction histidine-protein kinase/phosphatase MprB n=1 Tax=Solirubrobacter ginsenosidimutans TaxID=490573 RepID=A0A9X3S5I4_9ACTN|nr:HAMP domain-containing sensor histidine kinase [Solirubrobacter ginsenosidimutans]MDA0161653.1 HAMP domain-containing histidine kinase [Solirubrobacter ginsenosidimutans]
MRRRLIMAIAGVAAIAVVLFAVPLGLVLGRSYRDEELLRLQRDTIAATRAVDFSTDRTDPVELPPSSDALAVYDLAGRRLNGRGPARADAVVQATLRSGRPSDEARAGRLYVAVPIVVAEQVSGAVRAQRSDAAASHRTARAWALLAAGAGALVVFAILAALVLARRLVAPLDRLASAAEGLGEGDFAARAPRSGMGELDAVADALDVTAARLGELVARERAFSADASHQLRTPLAAMRIELEALELRGEELPAALEQVGRLQQTVETLLAVARDAPRRDGTTNLAGLVDEVTARRRGTLAADGRPLQVRASAADPVTSASARVIGEALEVLLDNAGRHGAGAVTLTIRDAGTFLAIDVGDEGAGFAGDPEEAFTRRAGAVDGHGIGLALARSLVLAEGGQLLVTRAGPHPVLTMLLPRRT